MLALVLVLVGVSGAFLPVLAGDPNALWRIVHGRCVPHWRQAGDPAPCLAVGRGYAVLKDREGVAQLLLIPTSRVAGMESPALLDPSAPNYWAPAWAARARLADRLPRPPARDEVGLAINSAVGRSQNQLHIHVDCLRPDIRAALQDDLAAIGPRWTKLAAPLAGHAYWGMRLAGAEVGRRDPFHLLAEGMPGARRDMAHWTLVLVGTTLPDGRPGFLLLADHARLAAGDRASGEELLDHTCSGVTVPSGGGAPPPG